MPLASLPDELRLLLAVLLNALVLWSAWRLTRRFGTDRIQRACDALLLCYLVQYLAVAVPGLVGALSPLTMIAAAVAMSVGMASAGRRSSSQPMAFDPFVAGAFVFVFGYVAALIFHQRHLPVISNDAITYHLPAAVQWLQTGRLGLYEAWFYNPANSYSPLAGSTFLAWLLAPIGNDVLARFAAAGPLIFLFVAVMNLCCRVGVSTRVAALVAASVVLARPFVSQTILSKDDLYVAAFFLALLGGFSRDQLQSRFGPWRIGTALGLLLATKYTVLFSIPILIVILDAPFRVRWRWKQWLIAIALILVLAAPWYLRNALLTGNPLYPTDVSVAGVRIFPGMLGVTRSDLLATPAGAWKVFTDPRGYYSIPITLAILLIAGWLAALIAARHEAFRDPLKRAVLIGTPISIALFVLAAPYGEMRFAYPAVALLFVAAAIASSALPRLLQIFLWSAVALLAALTAFRIEMSGPFALAGAIASAVVAFAWLAWRKLPAVRVVVPLLPYAAAAGLFVLVYIYWHAYIGEVEEVSNVAWSDPGVYGKIGEAWAYIRKQEPATIAYANTFFAYPLMGFNYRHRVTYAPTRHDLEDFLHMPRIDQPTTGEAITRHIGATLRAQPDRDQWLRRLKASGADYLIVGKQDPAEPGKTIAPPELDFAARDPQMFQRAFENEAAVVFKIAK